MDQVKKNILIIAGTHGVEPQSTEIANKLAETIYGDQVFKFQKTNGYPFAYFASDEISIVPDLNRYGLSKNTRTNENGVDLNRNMPSSNWSPEAHLGDKNYHPGSSPASEKETKALVEIIKSYDFYLIISIHTTHFIKHQTPAQINFDGEKFFYEQDSYGYIFAKKLSQSLGLPLTDDIGYETPGSLGSYCKEIDIPCITLELEDELNSDELWQKYGEKLILEINSLIS